MPPSPNEQTLLTLFADVHYCLSNPQAHPRNQRFEKSSYVYLYTTSALNARLEIANNPGTPHQDAFTGSLGDASLTYQNRQPNLVTIQVMRRTQEQGMWQLRTFDPSSQQGRMDLVQVIDMYFWTADDAQQFVEAAERLKIGEINVNGTRKESRANAGEHRDQMSPVVQKLEQAAISSPQPSRYPQHRDSTSTTSGSVPAQQTPSFPPPPPNAPQQQQHTPAPMAYNPAAPAAPEPIAHREKTPPPVDAGQGTGLNSAAYNDQQPSYPYGAQQPQYGGYQQHQNFSPKPLQHTQSFPPPPPSQHQTPPQPSAAYPTPPSSQHPQQYSHPASQSQTPSFSPPPQSPGYPQQRTNSLPFQQYAPPPTSPGYPPAATQNHTQVPAAYQPGLPSPAPNTGSATHASNPGYMNYSSPPPQQSHQSPSPYHSQSPYPQQPQHQQQQSYSPGPTSPGFGPGGSVPGGQAPLGGQVPSAHSIHSQVYQPSEAEMNSKPAMNTGTGGQAPGKLEGRASRLEGGVNRFLKRLDKHL